MSGMSEYRDLVHELARLESDTSAGAERAQRRLARGRESVEKLRGDLDEEVASLAEGCAALRRPVPDLAPEPVAGEELDEVVRGARVRLREASDARLAAMRAAQRPTFLPRVHHILRELLIYGAVMAACLLGQVLWLGATGGGDSTWWVMFLPPVLAALIGYVLVGAANKPRMPMHDRAGRPIKPVVPHNPRLGVTLAVVTMAMFAYFAFFA
ncbi:GtrA domain-containing protein [Glycomyces xiaoerkulensis]|uniref:hypothetical protein n=1 Tax=Glycomyces xiaoerkulensis TaxID=2038139 RepID=UPI0012FFD8F0|nr:hypothetical protein [Glycomyces xiaoerkulensis]